MRASDDTKPSVVIIEDDRDVRESLQGLFRSVGLEVEPFASVKEFLESARPDRRYPGQAGRF